jgi:hypothetical protein
MPDGDGYAVPHGPSIRDTITAKLDECYVEMVEFSQDGDADTISYLKGQCAGLAHALALMINPTDPDVRAQKLACTWRYENA